MDRSGDYWNKKYHGFARHAWHASCKTRHARAMLGVLHHKGVTAMPNLQDLIQQPTDARPLVVELLYRVNDPEVGVNIVDLGLVRHVEVEPGGNVQVAMTLTTPACPLGPYMEDNIRDVVGELAWVQNVDVIIVWEPKWNPQTDMTDRAKQQLGWSH